MILYRCFTWNSRASDADPDGPLWFPRPYQGDGRHDNPDLYGCLYIADGPVSSIVEQLARFRGHTLTATLLRRRGLPLALAALELPDDVDVLDLDDPAVLGRTRLRPSIVATRSREITQPRARALYERHRALGGLRWWSMFEATWINFTLFDRIAPRLRVRAVRPLSVEDPTVSEAARVLGLPAAG